MLAIKQWPNFYPIERVRHRVAVVIYLSQRYNDLKHWLDTDQVDRELMHLL